MHFVYIIESIKSGKWYIGCSSDIQNRLRQHNAGIVRSTKPYRPYKLIYYESYATKKEALERELQIKKSGYIRQAIKYQINKTNS